MLGLSLISFLKNNTSFKNRSRVPLWNCRWKLVLKMHFLCICKFCIFQVLLSCLSVILDCMAHCSDRLLLYLQLKAPLQILLKTFVNMPEEIMEGVIFWLTYTMGVF